MSTYQDNLLRRSSVHSRAPRRANVTASAGFSLVEVLVSLSLFTIVVTMGIGTLLVLIHSNVKAQYMQDVMTNLTFALDSMTREIRTGRSYFCPGNPDYLDSTVPAESSTSDCAGGSAFSIVEGGTSLTAGAGSSRVSYRLEGGRIERRVGTDSWTALTSPDVEINTLTFTVIGSDTYLDTDDTTPPTATIFIEGRAGDRAELDTSFSMQTTVTRRIIDL